MARVSAAATVPAGKLLPSQRIERFFRQELRHGKGEFAGRPFTLEPWQVTDIRGIYDPLVLRRGALVRQVDEAVIGLSKKNGKTHTAAGLGVFGLTADGYYLHGSDGWDWIPEYGAEVYNIAGSKDQAKVLFKIGSGFVERSPTLRAMCRIFRDAIEVPETESVWRVLAADARLAHGPNPSTTIIDEIWVHRDPELYTAFKTAGVARRQPLLITITTAGWDQTSIAYALYKRGRSARRSPRFYFHWYQAEGSKIDDPKALRAANPSRWVSLAYLRGELSDARRMGLENQYRRFHRNEWTLTKEQAIPLDLWDANAGRPKIPKGAEVMVGVDAAPKHDSTGIVVDHRDAARVHNVRATIMRANPDTGYLDFDLLEELLRELSRIYTVTRILVDPHFMIRSMLMLTDEGLPIEAFPQSDVRMVPASVNLFELLVARRIRHGGDPQLREQVQAASKRVTERGFRFAKRSSGNIDGLIAMTMVTYEQERAPEGEPPKQPSLFALSEEDLERIDAEERP